MYIRLRANKSGTKTVYLIDSIREEGKKHSSSKVVKCFGSSANEAQLAEWVSEAEIMKGQLAKQKITSREFINIKQEQDITSCKVEELGIRYLYNQLFHSLFADLNIKGINKQTLADLISMRIAMPVSKLRTANISSCFGINDLTVNKIYKMMDALDDNKIDLIKKHVLHNTKKLIANQIKVMFYDLTTIYFEANTQTELKEFGFSKDGKSQHVQISLALIVTDYGMPIGYEIFRGNSFEGSTLIPALTKLKRNYKVEDVTIVADSAMLSEANINALIANNFKFIVSAKVRNMNVKLTKEMLDQNGYKDASDNLKYKTIEMDKTKRLILVFSEDRKRKDEYDRNKSIEKIKKLEGRSSKSGLRGVLKKPYVKVNKDSVIEIDEAKIEYNKKFDGYFGFISNTSLDAEMVIAQYKGLWQVEQSFRITKHNLKIRPVYHYVDRRIKAHFAICYLSLALVRSLEHKLRMAGVYIPIEQLHMSLNEIKGVKLVVNGNETTIVTDMTKEIREVFVALHITSPKRFNIKCRV